MAVGDPACDLAIAWTLLNDKSREIFKSHLSLDEDTWARARGWALWKALIDNEIFPLEAIKNTKIIDEIIEEHKKLELKNI